MRSATSGLRRGCGNGTMRIRKKDFGRNGNMRCKKSDCFTCPYPDCINDDEPSVRVYTPEQKERIRYRARARRQRFKDAGLCSWCGKKAPTGGFKMCAECRIKMRRTKEDQNRQKGILPRSMLDGVERCQKCGKSPPVDGYKLCERCLASTRAHADLTPTHNHRRPVGWFNDAQEIYWAEHRRRDEGKAD